MKKEQSFFQPFVGEHYTNGINGKRMLITGASFYCDKRDCPLFEQCTDEHNPQTAKFNDCCTEYNNETNKDKHFKLSESATIEMTNFLEGNEYYPAYSCFTCAMCEVLNQYDSQHKWLQKDLWEYLAFTNYVQYMLPHKDTQPQNVKYEKNIIALKEILQKYRPDILCVWGTKVKDCICDELNVSITEGTGGYLGSFTFEKRNIIYINPYHPSSSNFRKSKNIFEKYMKDILLDNAKLK